MKLCSHYLKLRRYGANNVEVFHYCDHFGHFAEGSSLAARDEWKDQNNGNKFCKFSQNPEKYYLQEVEFVKQYVENPVQIIFSKIECCGVDGCDYPSEPSSTETVRPDGTTLFAAPEEAEEPEEITEESEDTDIERYDLKQLFSENGKPVLAPTTTGLTSKSVLLPPTAVSQGEGSREALTRVSTWSHEDLRASPKEQRRMLNALSQSKKRFEKQKQLDEERKKAGQELQGQLDAAEASSRAQSEATQPISIPKGKGRA
ncbi:MAG: hypothetical protein Q9160_006539 [Pyrenula sp. 1 TL-2023]